MADQEKAESAAPEASGGGKKKLIIFALAGLVLLGGAGGAGWYFLSGDSAADQTAAADAEQGPKEAIYHALSPSFVVNFQDKSKHRFLKLDLQVMARDDNAIDAVKQHEPMIRNNLLLLFGAQKADELRTREGKEKLRNEVLAELQNVVAQEEPDANVEQVFFTSFVMQ